MNNLKSFLPYVNKYRREFLLGVLALIVTDAMTLVVPWLIKEFIDIISLKSNSPVKQDTATIATLFIVKIVELSNPSTRKAFKRKYIEL